MLPPGKRRSVRTLGPAGVGSSAGARYNQPGTGACTAGERQPGGGRSVGTGGHPSVLLLTPLRVSMLPCKCAEDRPPWSAGGSREPSASLRASRAEAARAGARRRRGRGSIGCFNPEGPGQPLERRRREQSGAGQKGDGGAPSGVSAMEGTRPLPKGAGLRRAARRAGERDRQQRAPQEPGMPGLLASGGQEREAAGASGQAAVRTPLLRAEGEGERIRPDGGGSSPRVTSSETASKLGVHAAGSPWGPLGTNDDLNQRRHEHGSRRGLFRGEGISGNIEIAGDFREGAAKQEISGVIQQIRRGAA